VDPAADNFDLQHAPHWVAGTLWGLLSALGYALTNIFLRRLSVDTDPAWASCMKSLPTFLVAAVILARAACNGQTVWPGARAAWWLLATGLMVQFSGNLVFQWALGVIGLALSVPLSFGTMIVASGLLGRLWLREPITPRMLAAMALLLLSIALLSASAADDSHQLPRSSSSEASPWLTTLGVVGACSTGISYALVAVAVRLATRRLPVATTALIICGTGVFALGGVALLRLGMSGIAASFAARWPQLVAAGAFNVVGFFSLGFCLRYISVVHANVLNSAQIAIAATCGVLWFGEPSDAALVAGVALTIVGLVAMQYRGHAN
jgi:drug/metabolite transporter (DMT)-like permease